MKNWFNCASSFKTKCWKWRWGALCDCCAVCQPVTNVCYGRQKTIHRLFLYNCNKIVISNSTQRHFFRPPTQKFLNDYGMIWIGGYDEQANSKLPAVTFTRKSFKMNYDLVMQNIQELNIVAGEGESHVTAIPGGAKLTQKSSIPLWLYKNGIVMFSGPFRSYQEPTTQVEWFSCFKLTVHQ